MDAFALAKYVKEPYYLIIYGGGFNRTTDYLIVVNQLTSNESVWVLYIISTS